MNAQQQLPRFVSPMLAHASQAFDGDDHLFELKWDGIRAMAFVEPGGYRLLTRHRRDVSDAFPELAVLGCLPPGVVLDGELVVLLHGVPDLGAVQARQHTSDPLKVQALARRRPATYVAFDLLYRDYESVMDEPLLERRRRLRGLVEPGDEPWLVVSDGGVGSGTALFDAVCRLGLEGIMAKHVRSRYRPGRRSRAWLKIKPPRGTNSPRAKGTGWSSAPG